MQIVQTAIGGISEWACSCCEAVNLLFWAGEHSAGEFNSRSLSGHRVLCQLLTLCDDCCWSQYHCCCNWCSICLTLLLL